MSTSENQFCLFSWNLWRRWEFAYSAQIILWFRNQYGGDSTKHISVVASEILVAGKIKPTGF